MNTRWQAAVPALAALLCACLMVYLLFEVNDIQYQLQSDGIVALRPAQQSGHNLDTITRAQALSESTTIHERIYRRMDRLSKTLWVCCIMFFIALLFALLRFSALTRRADQLGVAAKQSQTQLNTALDELTTGDNARKAQNRFVAAASHDLRQPLHALGLYLQAMKNHVLDKQGKTILENSYRSAEALNQLLNSMLDLSRLDAGAIEVNPEHLSLDSVFANLQQNFAPDAQQRGLQLELSANGACVKSDPLLLNRVLTNLLGNALYYTETGSVVVTATATDKTVTISITDTGCGIAMDEQESIFDEYYQLHNPERDRTKGLGIGLSIVKRLTPLLNASLTLESAPDKGSDFRLTLPRGDKSLALDKPFEGVRGDSETLHDLSILVIDDEKDVRDGMEIVLEPHVHRVVAVESAQSALEYIVDNEWLPGMVIADYRLRHEQTGDNAIRQIREELNEDIPAMIITGDTSEVRLREAADTGIELMHKPVGADQLLAAIARLIGDRHK